MNSYYEITENSVSWYFLQIAWAKSLIMFRTTREIEAFATANSLKKHFR
jgi:hypothetical protein